MCRPFVPSLAVSRTLSTIDEVRSWWRGVFWNTHKLDLDAIVAYLGQFPRARELVTLLGGDISAGQRMLARETSSLCAGSKHTSLDEAYLTKGNLDLSKLTQWVPYNVPELSFEIANHPGWHISKGNVKSCVLRGGRIKSNPVVRRCFTALRNSYPGWLDIFNAAYHNHMLCDIDFNTWMSLGRAVTAFAKKYNSRFYSGWKDFVNIENFAGYNLSPSKENREEELRTWGEGELNYNLPGGTADEYKRVMAAKMVERLSNSRDPEKWTKEWDRNLKEFIASPYLWITSGAGDVQRFDVITFSGETIKVKKNRSATAYSQTVDELYHDIFDLSNIQPFRPADKVELGRKERIIIAAGTQMQVAMAYVMYKLSPAIDALQQSPIFMDQREQLQMWWEIISLLGSGKYAFPYDAPSFDQAVGTNEIHAFMDAAAIIVSNYVINDKEECLNVIDVIRYKLFHTPVVVDGTALFTWGHGLPSGIRWTALLGTLVNLARQDIANQIVSERLGWQVNVHVWGAGDDVLIISDNVAPLLAWYEWVREIGYGANPLKNFVSKSDAEFLRRVANMFEVRGYVNRRIAGLCYRDPTKPPLQAGVERMQERIAGVSILAERGANVVKCKNLVYLSLVSVNDNKIPMASARALAHTPSTYGGGGVGKLLASGAQGLGFKSMRGEKAEGVPIKGVFLTSFELTEMKLGHSVPKSAYQRQLLERLSPGSARDTKERLSKVFIDEVVVPLPTDPIIALWFRGKPLSWAPADLGDPQLLREYCIKSLNENKLDEALKVTAQHRRGEAQRIFSNWARPVAYDWIRGELDLATPVVLGEPGDIISRLSDYFRIKAMNSLLVRHRVEPRHVRRKSLWVERSVELSLARFPKRVPIFR